MEFKTSSTKNSAGCTTIVGKNNKNMIGVSKKKCNIKVDEEIKLDEELHIATNKT